jgi:transcriptional regulator of acetoin/glycerol metabolism
MPQLSGEHSRLVYSVIRGSSRHAEAPEYVKRSWQRCIDEYGLDPESHKLPVVVSRQELIARKERNSDLVAFADAEISHLHRQLAGSGHSILLTDRDAVWCFPITATRRSWAPRRAPACCPARSGASARAAPTAWAPASPSASR